MDIINGLIHGVEIAPTPIDLYVVTFMLGGERCKASNDLARTIEALEGQEVQSEGFWRPYRGEREFNVRSIKYRTAAGGFVTVVE